MKLLSSFAVSAFFAVRLFYSSATPASLAARLLSFSIGIMIFGVAASQTYPTRPIRIITAPAGAGNDFMARVIAQGLTASMGQQLVVDNRPAGLVGELVAKWNPR